MAKFTGKGASYMVNTGTTTPTWTEIGQVQEIGDIAVTAEEVDVTTLDAGDYRDYIQGFKDPGEVELTVIFDPEVATHGDAADGLIALFNSGAVKECAIRINSSAVGGESFLLFSAFIRDMTYGALNPDDPQTITPLFRLTSPITLADVLPTTLTAGDQPQQRPAARAAQRRAA
jgi:Lambda phage tail tube protein, TTP